MLPYETMSEAAAALGRNLTAGETLWFHYTAAMPDYYIYYLTIVILFVVFSLVPLPFIVVELCFPSIISSFKLQPKTYLPFSSILHCYFSILRILILHVGPIQLFSYPVIKLIGIRTGLLLPSLWEIGLQLLVYFIVEDYVSYWIHRVMHHGWQHEKIHKVHHEYTAPMGFVAAYAHHAEVFIFSVPSFIGPAIVPGHMITFWLWIILRQMQGIEAHCGYNFPFSPTKVIPFYGGAEFHDYHHYIGGQSQSNFAPVFTYCDYIYGTDKGYRYYKAHISKI
ncbi:Methylsterol monooxygenase protein [Dioscorea alata]|uniref:Methylsterol monooxygenase protein n=1 Tax=Dioscorea alata TaxID=55571 RepID=A0ACB7UQ47_DIOAL|nr:Methylsterol monooxygenase protein [Dioscorea alata]